ncbi:saccharopine dehydrogenase [Hysterangium stoloniferum]|nr:saccharopine dehydrogenase [Hysterangium stoloniferum]
MAPLTHPSIRDGWFREISSQWPGMAMTLKVVKILHVEKSKYQDVLVFLSETFGNVLVLDGVIQCTERDEFSYQEMIAHIPLASHPNPKKVLVIGGGDGGVVREVLRHESVEEVVLCDIDEAVIRVSKQYLPHMSSLLDTSRVRVYVGDGFKFLADNKSTYDVIITDSSDPVGPAAALFEQPYFQLLYNALAPGGHISTQAECLWLHLPLIADLRARTRKIFPVVEYAYTTIPTYPAGQIGFIVASKQPGRDLSKPLRPVPNTRYYNSALHTAAFTLPEFARVILDTGKNILPVLGPQAPANATPRKVLLLGSGYVARPAAEYIARSPLNRLTIACRTLAAAESLAESLPRTAARALNVTSTAALEAAVAEADLVVSLIPYTYHADVIRAAIKGKTDVVTTSYVSPAMLALDEAARAAGITVLNEIGLDPGIDHLYAVKTIGEIHDKGGKVKSFLSYCGGLPSPDCTPNPLLYKFSWSSRGVLLALLNPARFLSHAQPTSIPGGGTQLMQSAAPIKVGVFGFEGYANRDSVPFAELYDIPEAEEVLRGTLRWGGFCVFVGVLVGMGWLDQEPKGWLKEGMTWAEVGAKIVGAKEASESAILAAIASLLPGDKNTRDQVVSGLRWIGLLGAEKATVRATLLDTLCARLEELMMYEQGEQDMIVLQHRFGVQWKDGGEETLTSTLITYGNPLPGGYTAMALTVGLPCGIATQLVLDGEIKTKGVCTPYFGRRADGSKYAGSSKEARDMCELLRVKLEEEGVGCVEGKL